MLMPQPGTGIEKVALELGWLDKPRDFDMLPQLFFSRSVFEVPGIEVLGNVKDVPTGASLTRSYIRRSKNSSAFGAGRFSGC